MAIQGQIVSQPNDDGAFGERAVVNHLAVYRLQISIGAISQNQENCS